MKRILLTVSIFLTAAVAFGYYLFNKPHSSIVDETPIALSEAPALVGEYEADENSANAKYLGKVIEVTGTISDKNLDEKGILNLTLKGGDLAGIGCQFDKNFQTEALGLKSGEQVKIKGICTGILMDVVLVDCVISKESN
ncbi:MAG: hypothetical protein IPQ03_17425 [Bacteroidetes bacterium]|jgi:hypothetical protein|nr:hypothetical protein [Bacteroidota bacterium]MBP6402377.1 hypothetical protein [Bacteroidia bacterium]MBK9523163.1 hypothetical protein [Bacteroidota bacterium]MBK9540907.1 hypothetical protein [Bacteroidota bacterium]MBL0259212.1 hypothetical protein [Bacteroidota bacterium]